MGAIYVLNALVMATQERTREIGIFAAIGWSKARIMASIVIEGILMCVIGCALGLAAELRCGARLPAHSRDRQFGFLHAQRRADRIGARRGLRAVPARVAVPGWRAVRMLPAEALRRL